MLDSWVGKFLGGEGQLGQILGKGRAIYVAWYCSLVRWDYWMRVWNHHRRDRPSRDSDQIRLRPLQSFSTNPVQGTDNLKVRHIMVLRRSEWGAGDHFIQQDPDMDIN